MKNKREPRTLLKISRDFRGAISANAPATSKIATVKIVPGHFKTTCVFVSHAIRLVSISSTIGALLELGFGEPFGDELGEAIYLPDWWINGQTKDISECRWSSHP